MSKLRRLLLCSALLAGIVLLGAQALGMLTAHRHLSRQLAQQSESGARTLAWVLGRAPSTPHEREVLADELYSQGLYARIRIADEASGDSVDRGPDATTDASSGAWLERWFSLRAPAVSLPYASPDGAARGTVTVQGDATLANDTLWQGGVRAVGLALSAGLFWALFAISLARRIETSASRDISQRVRALAPGADASPSGSCGLESVDQALVDARRRVDATVEEQNARIESLQSEIHRDAVTWLPNRKYFMDRFRAALSDRTAEAGGHLLMFRQRDLAQINRHLSRAFTDQWLRSSADRLRRLVDAQGGSQALLARIGGSDFALLMPRSSAPQAGVLAERVRRELRSLRVPMGKHGWCRWALAMAEFAPGDGMSDTLARLDHALMCSESADDDQVAPASQAADSTRIGEYSWHDALTTALEQHKFALAVQALQDVSGGLLHHEASLTLHDASGADPVPASIFMPPAVRLGLSAECDIQALRLGLDWLYAQHGALAAPVALGSLSQPGFLARLEKMLGDRPALTRRLIIEVDAAGLLEQNTEMRELCRLATQAGARVGLTRLSQQFGALEHLHEFPFSYLKLGGGFVAGLLHSPGSQHLAATVAAAAQTLGMAVYAEDVPDTATQSILEKIGIHALRGAGVNFARPHDLAPDHQWVPS